MVLAVYTALAVHTALVVHTDVVEAADDIVQVPRGMEQTSPRSKE